MIMMMQIRVETHIHRKISSEEQSKLDSDYVNGDAILFSIEVSDDNEYSIMLKMDIKKKPETPATPKKNPIDTSFNNASKMKYDFKSVLKTCVNEK